MVVYYILRSMLHNNYEASTRSSRHQNIALHTTSNIKYFGIIYNTRNPICSMALQQIPAGRPSDWPPDAFYCPRVFFGERLPNARRSRARALLAPRPGQTVRGRVGVGVRVRVGVRVGVGWGLCRYQEQKCAKTSCMNSLQARPANRGSYTIPGRLLYKGSLQTRSLLI